MCMLLSNFLVTTVKFHVRGHIGRVMGAANSSVGKATGYWPNGLGSIPGMARLFSSPQRSDRFWGTPNLLFSGYRWQYSQG
jgi:hypothetical protein